MTKGPIALAAGGTGGHMFPAQALAQELQRRGRDPILVTDDRGDRYTKDFPANEKYLISAATPSVGGPIAKIGAAISIGQGVLSTWRQFKSRVPAAAIGFGGYPSLPTMAATAMLGVKFGVHEQNGVLGRVNRLLAKRAAFVAHAFPVLDKLPNGANAIEVGNPVRDAVRAHIDAPFPVSSGKIQILIFGGSQGATIFSTAPTKAIANLPEALRENLRVVHQVREDDVAGVREAYRAAGVEAEIAPFFDDLPARIAASSLVISRSGASSVTELSAIGRPSILVPLAIAMDDHQTGNARVLSEAKAAIVLPEKTFNEEALGTVMTTLLANPARLEAMAAAARDRVKSNAASALADLVEEIAA